LAYLRRAFGGIQALDDLTIPRESDPPVPNNIIKENDLPRSKLMAAGFSYLLVCIISTIILFVCESIRPQYSDLGRIANRTALENAAAWAIFAIALYFSAFLVFGIYYYTRIYKVWKSIQPFGVRTSPVAAIVFSFVPLFNLYWVFHVYYVWALNFNSKVRKFHPHLPPISTGHALTASISTIFVLIITLIISIVPELRLFGLLGPIFFLVLVVPFLSSADRRARYLLDGPEDGIDNGIDENTARKWAMLFHFSPLNPLVGFIATIIIWQVKKDIVPGLDEHGRSVANWHFSCVVYLIVSSILDAIGLYFIGGVLMNAVVVCYIVFPIIGGLKAKKGEVWRYPLSIQFLS
jgi:hypothetical protein